VEAPRVKRRRVSTEKRISTTFSTAQLLVELRSSTREAAQYLWMLVAAVAVKDDVAHFAGRHGSLDGVRKAQELLAAVALHAAPEYGAFEHIEGGEQGGYAGG
jgi:hypothetical protein